MRPSLARIATARMSRRAARSSPRVYGASTLGGDMAVLVASGLRKEYSGDALFEGVSFTVRRGDRLALAGPNGAGKTTLLRAIVGETSLQGGQLSFAKDTRVALHDQRPPRELGLSLREYALSAAAGIVAIEEELRRLENAMAAGDDAPATLRRYGEAQAKLEHAGGWAWRERAAATLRASASPSTTSTGRSRPSRAASSTRASLARALAGDPDLLLLDEPTNHLDVDNLEWLERTLVGLDAGVVLVAHDRWFLEAVTTAVLELAPGGPQFFASVARVAPRKSRARSRAAKTVERVSDDIERLERFVARFRYKKTKAKQAQAKLTQIGRLSEVRARASGELESLTKKRRTLGFEFLRPPRSGRVVLEAEDIDLAAGDKQLLDGAELALERGGARRARGAERLGQDDARRGAPRTAGAGRGPSAVRPRRRACVLLAARAGAARARDRLECAQRATGLKRPEAQHLLGRFLFSGWEMHERDVSVLSGGERRRLALALLVASGANLLVLDEPTNHLDLESREALEAALEAYPGTILLVSHDRAMLDAVPDRLVAIEDGQLRSYDGGWADLVRERDERQAAARRLQRPRPSPSKPRRAAAKPAKRRPTKLEQVEARIATLERRVAELEGKLAEDWANMDVLSSHRAARDELQALLSQWEALFEAAQGRLTGAARFSPRDSTPRLGVARPTNMSV